MLARDVGIRFKGVEKTNVEEYCVSEGWVRVTAGNAKDRYGNPLTIKVHGPVEPYFRDKGRLSTLFVIARSVATKQSILSAGDAAMDCFAEFTIGRAYARPGGSQ